MLLSGLVNFVTSTGDGSLQLIRDSTVIGTEQRLFSKEVLQNSNTVPWLKRSCRSRVIFVCAHPMFVCVIVFVELFKKNGGWMGVGVILWIEGSNEI